MKEQLINILDLVGLAWWVEIVTDQPKCTYYFGPFLNAQEAHEAKTGYFEDLQAESAQGIKMVVKRCKPTQLTACDDLGENVNVTAPSTLNTQLL
ncbi:DUF1816 domain-containing protein [Merismopedia glauca]|uniref:DUF1816 domain-containing protein n=1 Tax=Merismopedia glauca CCAP 1448/3 TaxID=1296344 RepID=A0A2T1C595_9CYAN|nr:DUF1816 domain-containing protein [Merismopedia glauca]PSB03426.1 hypothetical protein C7B64_08420 [Merismopedia glauca CCAP 1448/3]